MSSSKGKGFYQQTMSSLYYKIQSTWKGYASMKVQKRVMAEAKIFHQICGTTALQKT